MRNVLVDYRRDLEALGAERTLTIATSAVRDAENGEAFLGEIEWSYGFTTRLLTGEEEALMTYRGVSNGRGPVDGTLVIDVGGGSTELVLGGDGGVSFHTSLDLGCVRLTERFVQVDPPAPHELADCRSATRALLAERVPDDVLPSSGIGVAGTVTTLAAIELGLDEEDPALIHGHKLTAERVETDLAELARLTVAELAAIPAITPERAPVFVAGVAVVAETMRYFGLDELEISSATSCTARRWPPPSCPSPKRATRPPGAYTCC